MLDLRKSYHEVNVHTSRKIHYEVIPEMLPLEFRLSVVEINEQLSFGIEI